MARIIWKYEIVQKNTLIESSLWKLICDFSINEYITSAAAKVNIYCIHKTTVNMNI